MNHKGDGNWAGSFHPVHTVESQLPSLSLSHLHKPKVQRLMLEKTKRIPEIIAIERLTKRMEIKEGRLEIKRGGGITLCLSSICSSGFMTWYAQYLTVRSYVLSTSSLTGFVVSVPFCFVIPQGQTVHRTSFTVMSFETIRVRSMAFTSSVCINQCLF